MGYGVLFLFVETKKNQFTGGIWYANPYWIIQKKIRHILGNRLVLL